MAVSYDDTTQKAKLDALDTMVGTSPLLRIYSGSAPATANAALSGNTLLAELAMSSTAFGAAAGTGTVTKTANAISSDTSADATGTATFFRIYKSDGTTCRVQGSVGTSGADLNLNSTSITSGGTVAVSSLVITAAND